MFVNINGHLGFLYVLKEKYYKRNLSSVVYRNEALSKK